MDSKKLIEIIETKNDRLEQAALHTADQIISTIVAEQRNITVSQEHIKNLRAELATLEVVSIDPATVLG